MKKKNAPKVKPAADRGRKTPRLSTTALVVIVTAIVIAGVAVLSLASGAGSGVSASANPAATPENQGRFIPTRKIIRDTRTGELRLPTREETDKLVADLARLTKGSEDGPVEAPVVGGGTSLDLETGYAGVLLGRPNADGTTETLCVFTFEEGIQFLGLVEQS